MRIDSISMELRGVYLKFRCSMDRSVVYWRCLAKSVKLHVKLVFISEIYTLNAFATSTLFFNVLMFAAFSDIFIGVRLTARAPIMSIKECLTLFVRDKKTFDQNNFVCMV